MRVITWNLGYWQFTSHHAEAWAPLRCELKPDIAVLQEVRIPPLEEVEAVIFKPVRAPWGTAIYIKGGLLKELPMQRYQSRVAAATFCNARGREFRVASIHSPIIDNHVFPYLSHIFDELQVLFSGHVAILGGDLNSARLAEKVWPGNGHGPFFEQLERGSFFDCHRKFNTEEVQTFFRPGAVHPFQDDHLFVSRDIADQVTSCTAVHNDITRRVSDHIPLIAEIDV